MVICAGTPSGPAAGSAQWRGTCREQNDAMFFSDYDPVRGMLIALADGIGLEADAGQCGPGCGGGDPQ